MSHVTEISEQLFVEQVLQAKLPVLVDFFAPWCGPCRALAPTLEDIATDPSIINKVKIVKINIDNNEALAQQYKIRTIPTLILFKNDQQLFTISGSKTKAELIKLLTQHL